MLELLLMIVIIILLLIPRKFACIWWNARYREIHMIKEIFKSRLSLIVRVNVVLIRTVVVDSDWRFDNQCGSHLQSQSELYDVSWWYYTLVIDLTGQLRRDVIGRLSVKPWWYWLWRLLIRGGFITASRSKELMISLQRQLEITFNLSMRQTILRSTIYPVLTQVIFKD